MAHTTADPPPASMLQKAPLAVVRGQNRSPSIGKNSQPCRRVTQPRNPERPASSPGTNTSAPVAMSPSLPASLQEAVVRLPHAPVFNRMLLEPPSAEESEHIDQRESLVNYEHLLGRSGIAVTRLAPSGKAQFGDELVDVITAGEFVDRDSQVVVVEVRGNCVVVGPAQV